MKNKELEKIIKDEQDKLLITKYHLVEDLIKKAMLRAYNLRKIENDKKTTPKKKSQ